ncbi:MAG: UDP-glucose 4-epimerase [Chloroflexi bacterium]|jgi:UDP-glucose 4-epimerase|nr:MAG: UDP-glucose 4-epimerase [Chloroflexota bacterium]
MILITGGMGFIGLHTARSLLDMGQDVVLTQHRARREPDFLKDEIGKRITIDSMDVTNTYEVQEVVRRHKVDAIISLVAPPVRGATPRGDMQVYTVGLLNLLEASRINEVPRLLLASSVSVYTGLAQGPYSESDLLPIESKNQVEAFKKAMETLALHYGDRTSLNVASLRIGSIYGPMYYSMFNLPSRLTHAAVKSAEPDYAAGVPFTDDEADWCYVKDLAKGVAQLATAPKLNHRIYNLGGGQGFNNTQILAAVQKAVPGFDAPLQAGLSPAGKTGVVMDNTRAKEDVGYAPTYDIERGVADYAEWLKAGNPQ